jgi:hypothetical protein
MFIGMGMVVTVVSKTTHLDGRRRVRSSHPWKVTCRRMAIINL